MGSKQKRGRSRKGDEAEKGTRVFLAGRKGDEILFEENLIETGD
jgi:hypothetical protein